MKLSHLKSKNGFSIMEVMIAAGLLGVVTVGVMQLTRNMTKGQKSQAQQLEFNQIQSQIHSLLRDEYSCESTLLGFSPSGSGTNITQVKRKKPDGTTAVVFEKGQTYGSPTNPIFLKSMAIKNFDTSSGLGDFYIEMNKGRKDFDTMNQDEKNTVLATSYGTAVVSRTIKLNMVLDGAGKIKDCLSDKDDYTSGACAMIDGDWGDKTKCKSINVRGNGVEPSITAETNLHVKSGLNVGSTLAGDPGDGNATFLNNIDVRGRASVSNDATLVSGHLIFFDGDARINQEPLGNLYIENRAGTAGANIIAGKTGAVRTTITPNTLSVNINGTVSGTNKLEVAGDGYLSGNARLTIGSGSINYDGTDLNLNRPTGKKVNYRDDIATNVEVASRGFVDRRLADALTGDPGTLTTLLSNLSAVVGTDPTMAIAARTCAFYTNMTWNGTRCVDTQTYDCGSGRRLQGWSGGIPNCQPIVYPNQNCPTGQLLTGHDSNGTKICANADTQIGNYVDAKIENATNKSACLSMHPNGWFNAPTCSWPEYRTVHVTGGCWGSVCASGSCSNWQYHTCGWVSEEWGECDTHQSRTCSCPMSGAQCGGTSCGGWSPPPANVYDCG